MYWILRCSEWKKERLMVTVTILTWASGRIGVIFNKIGKAGKGKCLGEKFQELTRIILNLTSSLKAEV